MVQDVEQYRSEAERHQRRIRRRYHRLYSFSCPSFFHSLWAFTSFNETDHILVITGPTDFWGSLSWDFLWCFLAVRQMPWDTCIVSFLPHCNLCRQIDAIYVTLVAIDDGWEPVQELVAPSYTACMMIFWQWPISMANVMTQKKVHENNKYAFLIIRINSHNI